MAAVQQPLPQPEPSVSARGRWYNIARDGAGHASVEAGPPRLAARARRPLDALRARRSPRRDAVRPAAQRQRLPHADGAVGRRADPPRPRASRRLVPVALARVVLLPPLPEPPGDADRVRRRCDGSVRHGRRTSGSSISCSRRGRSPSTPGRGCSAGDGGRRRARRRSPLSSSRRPATASSGGATSGRASACTDSSGRCGSCRSRGGSRGASVEGRAPLRGRRHGRRAHDRVPLHRRLSRAAHDRRVGDRARRRPRRCRASSVPPSSQAAAMLSRSGCSCR